MLEKKEQKVSTELEKGEKVQGIRVDLDTIYKEELGEFGLYQLRALFALILAVMFMSWTNTEYIFSTARIPTRCRIPECDSVDNPVFLPEWLPNAVPTINDDYDNCQRFASIGTNFTTNDHQCPANLFDQQTIVDCDEYLYENTDTVVYAFQLACDEWRRSLIGSLRTVGNLVALPLAGFVSDLWGRRLTLLFCAINAAWLGSMRYFTNTYIGFVIAHIVESIFTGGSYSTAYILIMEVVGPKHRVAASAVLVSCYDLGQIFVALIAWVLPNWRKYTLVVFIPQFITITLYWIVPESVRWYLTKQRYDDAIETLQNIARVNKKELSESSVKALKENAEEERKKEELEKMENAKEPWLIVLVFQYKPILLRCIVSPVWWIATTLIYYGLSINAVNISGNPYINFIAVTAVGIPGAWAGVLAMNTIGRRLTLILSFLICAACQFIYLFMSTPSLAVYLVGKFCIAVVAAAIYVYTSELYPTKYRHRLFAFSSMMGRIGAIVAPLTPALGDTIPYILFGSFALAAGLLLLLTPETLGAKFPDTMEEAVATGVKKKETD